MSCGPAFGVVGIVLELVVGLLELAAVDIVEAAEALEGVLEVVGRRLLLLS